MKAMAALVLLLAAATLLICRVAESRREVEAVAASNATLELQSELLAAKVRERRDHAAELDAELAARRSSVAQLLKLFPSPEIATPERLLELTQDLCLVTGLRLQSYG